MVVFMMFIIVLLSVLYLFIKWQYLYWQRNKIPFVKPKFPLGSLALPTDSENIPQQLAKLYLNNKSDSPILGVFSFIHPLPMVMDLELIRSILIKDFPCFQSRGAYFNKNDPLSVNLVTLEYDQWKPLRSKVTTTFTSSRMKFMFPTIVAVGNELVACLSETTKTNCEIEIRDVLARFTTDVIGTCAFGIQCNSLKDPNAQFRVMSKKKFDEPKLNFLQNAFVMTYPKLARFLDMREHHKDVTAFFTDIVHETIQYREQNEVHRNDFLDLLIQLKNSHHGSDGLTIDEITAQAFVFFTGGLETSSLILTYCLYELALDNNKHIQEKARKEIQIILERHNGDLTYEALTEMIYCDQILNETLRKYPPISTLGRICNKPYEVFNTNFTIPKGMLVMYSILGIHHDPEFYPDPEEFIPERFSPEEVKKRPSCSFLPFGDGPRNCIATRFAMLLIRIGLVCLLQNFKFSTCSRTEIPLKFCPKKLVLSPKGGVWLKTTRIHKTNKKPNGN